MRVAALGKADLSGGFILYNPQKPNKFHIKLYEVCEASTGWVCGFDFYTGFTEATQCAYLVTEVEELRQATKIVIGGLGQCGPD